jgi:hypothetical protein
MRRFCATWCAISLIRGFSAAVIIARAAESVAKREKSCAEARCATITPARMLARLAPWASIHAISDVRVNIERIEIRV